MTPQERWRELKEMTDDFNKKHLIKHHMVRTINEALGELQAENAKLWAAVNAGHRYYFAAQKFVKDWVFEEALAALGKSPAPPEKHVNQSI